MPISQPEVTFSIIPASQLAGVASQRVLVVGQMGAAGLATDGALIREFPNDGSEDAQFAATSHIAGLVRAFKEENKVSYLDVIPLADSGTGVAATAVITLTSGPATDGVVFYVSIGSKKEFRAKVTVTALDTITEIGDAIVAAFASYTKKPFTLSNSAGVVTITAANKGTLANEWGIEIEGDITESSAFPASFPIPFFIPGVTLALTGWTGGANDPILTGILDVVGDTRYQTIIWPSAYPITEVQDLLDARFNVSNNVLDGVAIQTKVGTLSAVKSYIAAINSQSVVVVAQKAISEALYIGPSTMEFPDIMSSQISAIRALRKTQGAVLTRYLTTVAARDQFGGIALATLPYFNTDIPNLSVGKIQHEFNRVDIAELTANGAATIGPNQAYNGTIFGEFATTYLTDTAGNSDDSYKFLNTVDAASVIREYFYANFKSRYAQTRLTDGDLVEGRDMANAASIRAFCNRLYNALADEAIVQKGVAAKKDYNQNLVISIDVRTGTATINQAPLLVSQFRAAIGTIQINFGG